MPFEKDVILLPKDVNNFISRDFDKEKDMCDYFEDHINRLCKEIFNDKLIKYKREYSFAYRHKRGMTIDFFVECEKRNYAIEFKNPKNYLDLIYSVSQLMAYKLLFKNKGIEISKIILMTSMFDQFLIDIIKEYNLDIEITLFCKNRTLTYVGPSQQQILAI